jgi:transcriptional regulator with XRE-family HTH domain
MSLIDIATEFKNARIASRLTQREVAQATGLSSLLVSQLERGALTEIGAVKLLALLRKVGLELYVRPTGHQRTLGDIAQELDAENSPDVVSRGAQRVRHARGRTS